MVDFFIHIGYVGLFVACFISGTIIPFSSDIILISLIATGWDWKFCLLLASMANGAGGMVNYYLGSKGKTEWIEKYSNIKPEKINRLRNWLKNKGGYMAFFSWIPGVGHVMVIALGYMKANVWIVAPSLFAGKFLRYVVIIILTLKGVEWLGI